MGLKVFKIEREALQVECDDPKHDGVRTAFFDSGSVAGNLQLVITAGWTERWSDRASLWICPQCVFKNARKRARKVA
jgi:hypothetical protein